MKAGPDTQREYKFNNIETAIRELNKLGFSLDDSLFPKEPYHVIPTKIEDDYPTMKYTKTPRIVAVVDSTGKLIFDKPFDDNPILIKYQAKLEKLFS